MDRDESDRALRRLDTKLDVFGKISRIMDGDGTGAQGVADQPASLRAGPFNISFLAPGQGDLVLRAHAMLVKAAETVGGYLDYRPTDVAVSLGCRAVVRTGGRGGFIQWCDPVAGRGLCKQRSGLFARGPGP